jgi:hypothetical protein
MSANNLVRIKFICGHSEDRLLLAGESPKVVERIRQEPCTACWVQGPSTEYEPSDAEWETYLEGTCPGHQYRGTRCFYCGKRKKHSY